MLLGVICGASLQSRCPAGCLSLGCDSVSKVWMLPPHQGCSNDSLRGDLLISIVEVVFEKYGTINT
jgi:hypothetical protein